MRALVAHGRPLDAPVTWWAWLARASCGRGLRLRLASFARCPGVRRRAAGLARHARRLAGSLRIRCCRRLPKARRPPPSTAPWADLVLAAHRAFWRRVPITVLDLRRSVCVLGLCFGSWPTSNVTPRYDRGCIRRMNRP